MGDPVRHGRVAARQAIARPYQLPRSRWPRSPRSRPWRTRPAADGGRDGGVARRAGGRARGNFGAPDESKLANITDDRVPAGQLSERRNGEQRTGGTRLEHGALERPRPHVVHVGCSSPRLNRAAAGYDVGRVRQRRGATRPDARTGEGAACLAAHVPREVARLHHGQRGHGRRTAWQLDSTQISA